MRAALKGRKIVHEFIEEPTAEYPHRVRAVCNTPATVIFYPELLETNIEGMRNCFNCPQPGFVR